MKHAAQPSHSTEGQQAFEQHARAFQQMEDLSSVTIRNNLSELHQFIARCECSGLEERDELPFTPQSISPPFLMHYRPYLQTTLWLKSSTVNRALMRLKRFFAWTVRTRIIQQIPTSAVEFVRKVATVSRHLSDEEESALGAAVNAIVALQDFTIFMLLLHTRLRARKLCTLMGKQMHLGKRNGTLRIIGKRNKVRNLLHDTNAVSVLGMSLKMLPLDSAILYVCEAKQDLPHDVEKIVWVWRQEIVSLQVFSEEGKMR
jgi:site-specific recombinase XerD